MPFVFLTALTDRENELKGRQLGADDYVTKPIDFDVLDAILHARLARSPGWMYGRSSSSSMTGDRDPDLGGPWQDLRRDCPDSQPSQADGRFSHR